MRNLRRFWLFPLLITGMAFSLIGSGAAVTAQDTSPELAHLVLGIEVGGTVAINRVDWDVNAFAPVVPGTAVRSSDFLELSGRTTARVLCADLVLLEQRGSEVPRCDLYAQDPAFRYADDPAWQPDEGSLTIVALPADLALLPADVDATAFTRNELVGDELARVLERTDTIASLDLPVEAQAFALAAYYRTEGMVLDALGVLSVIPDVGCSARRPTVELPGGDDVPLVQSPVLYLRIGELYQMLDLPEDAQRNYLCATRLAEAIGDPATTALGYARQATLFDDPARASEFFQAAIDNYAALGATEDATMLLDLCGRANCALPE